jgi:hypothetical protein
MASLSEVNQRLKDREIQLEIKERQFRPNILASGTLKKLEKLETSNNRYSNVTSWVQSSNFK